MILTLSDIKINTDFENLIPKQTVDQFKQLEENILKESRARNPLVVWKGHDLLVDGHHRLRILKAHPELGWSFVEQEFADEEEVKEWIIKNALGTRNLTEVQFKLLLAELYKMRKKKAGGQKGNKNAEKQCTQNGNIVSESPKRVSEQLAEEMGVAKNTVIRAEQFADSVEAAEKVIPGIKERIESGELKAQKGEVIPWRKQTPEQIKQAVAEIEKRNSKKRKSANRETDEKIRKMDAVMSGVSTPQYGLTDLVRECNVIFDNCITSLEASFKRRKTVIESYAGSRESICACIDEAIEKLNEMKKGLKE